MSNSEELNDFDRIRLQDLEEFADEIRAIVNNSPEHEAVREALLHLDDFEKGEGMTKNDFPIESSSPATIPPYIAERTLPHSHDAERGLLAAILQNNKVLGPPPEVMMRLGWLPLPDEFHRDAHRRIFHAMEALRVLGEPIDFTTLMAQLEQTGELDEVGSSPYLRFLVEYPQSDFPKAYAKIIREKKHIRNLIFVLNTSLAECYAAELSAKRLLWNVLRRIGRIGREIFLGPRPEKIKKGGPHGHIR